MGRVRRFFSILFFLAAFGGSTGCGGGGSSAGQQVVPPTPSAPDFSLTISPNSLALTGGTTSAPATLSVGALHGFSGNVQVTLSGLPAGLPSSPVSPFSVPGGGSQSVVFGAVQPLAAGSYTVTAQASTGSLSHSASLSITVQAAPPPPALPRTNFARTDSVPSGDDPPGELHRRRIVYDAGRQHIFVANPAMNRVEVLSSTDATRVAQIAVPDASSVDLSADGATLWVGSGVQEITVVDAAALQVRARYPVAGLPGTSNAIFNLPMEVVALAGGKGLVRLRRPDALAALPALWDPATNSFTDVTSRAPAVFQNGAGVLARSGDHTKVLAAAGDTSGSVALLDASANVAVGPVTLGTGSIELAAANGDASRFAVLLVNGGVAQVLLLDGTLQVLAARAAPGAHGLVFSRDGSALYVSENADLPPVITVLSSQDLSVLGQAPDLRIGGERSEIEEADETAQIFGIANRGVSFLDAANPGTLPSTAPVLAAVPALAPPEGPAAGGTATTLAGQNFEASAQMRFAAQPGLSVNVAGATQMQATSPPSAGSGPVNVAAYFPSGWLALAPAAFSYGPQILEVLPNAGKKPGGDTVQIYGHGFGADAAGISVTFGGAGATVQKVEDVTALLSSGSVGADYAFPIERLTVTTPAGTAGKADVVVRAPAGNVTAAKAWQFLQDVQTYAKAGLYKFLLYDRPRQLVYLSNNDHVDVFDLAAKQFRAAELTPSCGAPSTAGLRGLALTPDGTKLVVADFGSQAVDLLNLDAPGSCVQVTSTVVPVGGVAGFTLSGPARVAATSTQAVFVGLSGEAGSAGACTGCLKMIDLTANPPAVLAGPQPAASIAPGAPLLQAAKNGDRVFLAFGAVPGGPVAVWDAATPGQFTATPGNELAADLGAAADGTILATRNSGAAEIRGVDLAVLSAPSAAELEQIPGRVLVPGLALHPSGALLYQPFLTGAPGSAGVRGGVDILDAHSGQLRLRVFLPNPLLTAADGLRGSFFATDENGQRLFALTSADNTAQNAGLTVVQLANVPLGIGSLAPATGPAAGGTQITLRGSGFQSGVQVTIGGAAAGVTLVDRNTLTVTTPALQAGPQLVVVTNADGESVSLDAAFTAN
ncbi:MAG: IPT/TIG domain-containing protein [Acidobacteriia bacterium]|nr:IPT/TIG domain-containing protein [Terriglobia bacterium]